MIHKLRPRISSVLLLEKNLAMLDCLRQNLGEKLYRHFEAISRINFDMYYILPHVFSLVSIVRLYLHFTDEKIEVWRS